MIYGIQKLSLIDYPSLPCFVIFLGGCNFRCPFCHNESIVNKKETLHETEDVIKEIKKRTSFLSAVVITGGEPTIYGSKLIDLIKEIKKLHLKIKLDTNGTNPTLLKKIIELKLVDYIAMDIKNTWEKYQLTSGVPVDIKKIKESIKLIETSGINYEFRCTINKEMHTKKDIREIQGYLKDSSKLFLQPYRYQPTQIMNKNFGEWEPDELKELESDFKVKS